jgi:hypothetical protein
MFPIIGAELARQHDIVTPMANLLTSNEGSDPTLLSFVAAAIATLSLQVKNDNYRT